MPNYIVIHKQSQLITSVVTSSSPPKPGSDRKCHTASEAMLTKYYKLKAKANRQGVLVNVGDLAAVSPSFLESMTPSNERPR